MATPGKDLDAELAAMQADIAALKAAAATDDTADKAELDAITARIAAVAADLAALKTAEPSHDITKVVADLAFLTGETQLLEDWARACAVTPLFNGGMPSRTPPAVATALQITTQPSPAPTSGQAFPVQPVVRVIDQYGKLWTSGSALVTVALASGGDAFTAPTFTVSTIGGVATFAGLTLTGPGPDALNFTAPGLNPATSTAIVPVVPARAATLQIVTQPSASVTSGTDWPVQPVVRALDQFGALWTGAVPGGVSISNTIGALTLNGVLNVAAVNGVATFAGIFFTGTGTDSVTFTASGLSPATSVPITVAASVGTPVFFPNIAALGYPILHANDFTGAGGLVPLQGLTQYWNGGLNAASNFVRTLAAADSPADTRTVMVYRYPLGMCGGGWTPYAWPGYPAGPGQLRADYATPLKEVCVGYILRFKSPWQSEPAAGANKLHWHGAAGNGIGQFWGEAFGAIGGTRNPIGLPAAGASMSSEMGATSLILTSSNNNPADPNYSGPGCTSVPYSVDVWYRIEERIRMATTTNSNDGICQVWVSVWNGSAWGAPVLAINRTNLDCSRPSAVTIGSSNFEFLWGGGSRVGYDNQGAAYGTEVPGPSPPGAPTSPSFPRDTTPGANQPQPNANTIPTGPGLWNLPIPNAAAFETELKYTYITGKTT